MQYSTLDEAWGPIKPKTIKKKYMPCENKKLSYKQEYTPPTAQAGETIKSMSGDDPRSRTAEMPVRVPESVNKQETPTQPPTQEAVRDVTTEKINTEIIKNEGRLISQEKNNTNDTGTEIELLNLLLHMSSGIFIIVLIDVILSYKK